MTVGIDLGTTHSLVALYEAGLPLVLADRDGQRLLPSAVYFPEGGLEPVVGYPALRQQALASDRTVLSIKRLMGRRDQDGIEFPHPVMRDESGRTVIQLAGGLHRPEALSALLLSRLKETAEQSLGAIVDQAVITVPAYFNDAQRAATKEAGELAGLKVMRIISEPTAAALAYGLDRLGELSRIAVFDLGGGTFDVSILQLHGGVFEVLSTHGDTNLGGDDLDAALADWLAGKLGWDDLTPPQRARLREEASRIKKQLSETDEALCSLPFADGGAGGQVKVKREDLETLARPILQRVVEPCRRALHDAGIAPSDLQEVILAGGATRMPLVRQMVREIFQREPDVSCNPDEVVALGAAIQAAILDGTLRHVTLLDVTPLSLGIETFGGLMNVLIPRNTTIPCKAGEMFTNAVDGQTAMRITVLQGERELAADNWELGRVTVPFTPAPRGTARVGVQFEIDANGILSVLTRDIASGKDTVLQIDHAVQVDDAKVEEMIGESVDHAFEDMNARLFVESSQKARELLAAVEVAYQQLGDDLEAGLRAEIDTLAAATHEALAKKELQNLRACVSALDDLTEPLATQVLEKLMAE